MNDYPNPYVSPTLAVAAISARLHNVTFDDMLSRTRSGEASRARMVAYWAAWRLGKSQSSIARSLRKAPSSVQRGVHVVEGEPEIKATALRVIHEYEMLRSRAA